MRFYTGQDVAVLDLGGNNYFSPHPVLIINTKEKLVQFLVKQKITYAVLKKGGVKAINDLPAKSFRVSVLKNMGFNYMVRIEFLKYL